MTMIEIKCTEAQKRRLIQAWRGPDGCFWPTTRTHCFYDPNSRCAKCYETKIKWHIVKRGAKANNKE